MSDLQRWGLSTKWINQLRWVKSKTGPWYKVVDVEPLEERIAELETSLQQAENAIEKMRPLMLLPDRIKEMESALKNISNGDTPRLDGRHETSAEIYQEYAKKILVQAELPIFENTYCSQCGREFGPGDHGYSHCDAHLPSRGTG